MFEDEKKIKGEILANTCRHFEHLVQEYGLECSTVNQHSLSYPDGILITSLKSIQGDCLSLLSHTEPQIKYIALAIIGLSITTLGIACTIDLSTFCEYWVVLLVAIPHSFSWLLIRHSSTYFALSLIFMIAVILFVMRSNWKVSMI